MDRMLRLTVLTSWSTGSYVSDEELPLNWDEWSDGTKETFISDAAQGFLNDTCKAYGEVLDDSDG